MKRLLGMVLALCMVISTMPILSVSAAGEAVDGWAANPEVETASVGTHTDGTRGEVIKVSKPVSTTEFTNFNRVKLATKVFDRPIPMVEGTPISIEFWLKVDGRMMPNEWAELSLQINDTDTFIFGADGRLHRPEGPMYERDNQPEIKFIDNEWMKFKLTLTPEEKKIGTGYDTKKSVAEAWIGQYYGGTSIAKVDAINSISFTYKNKWDNGAVSPTEDTTLNLYIDNFTVSDGVNREIAGYNGWNAWENIDIESEYMSSEVTKATDASRGEVVMISKEFDINEHTKDKFAKLATYKLVEPAVIPDEGENDPFILDFWIKAEGRTLEDKWTDIIIMLNDQMCYSLARDFTIGRDGGGIFEESKNMKVNDGTWVHINAELKNGLRAGSPTTKLVTKARFDDRSEWVTESWGGGHVQGSQIESVNSISIGYKNSYDGSISTWPKPKTAGALKVYIDDMTITGAGSTEPPAGELTPVPAGDGWVSYNNIQVTSDYKSSSVEIVTDGQREGVAKISKQLSTNENTTDAMTTKLATKTLDKPIVLPKSADDKPAVVEFSVKTEGRNLSDNASDILIWFNETPYLMLTSKGAIQRDSGGFFGDVFGGKEPEKPTLTLGDGEWVKFKLNIMYSDETKNEIQTFMQRDGESEWIEQYWGGGFTSTILNQIDTISVGYRATASPAEERTLVTYIDDIIATNSTTGETGGDPVDPGKPSVPSAAAEFDGWKDYDFIGGITSQDTSSDVSGFYDPERGNILKVSKTFDKSENTNNNIVKIATKVLDEPIQLDEALQLDFTMMVDGAFDEGENWAEFYFMADDQIIFGITPGNETNNKYIVCDKGDYHAEAFKPEDDYRMKPENGRWYKLRMDMTPDTKTNIIGTMPSIFIDGTLVGGWGGSHLNKPATEIKSFSIGYKTRSGAPAAKDVNVYIDKINVHAKDVANNLLPGHGGWYEYDNMDLGGGNSVSRETHVMPYSDSTRGNVTKVSKPVSTNEFTNFNRVKLTTMNFNEPVVLKQGEKTSVEFWFKVEGRMTPNEWAELSLQINGIDTFIFGSDGKLARPQGAMYDHPDKPLITFEDGEWMKFKLEMTPGEKNISTNYATKTDEASAWVDQYYGGTNMSTIAAIESISIAYKNKWANASVPPSEATTLNLYIDDLAINGEEVVPTIPAELNISASGSVYTATYTEPVETPEARNVKVFLAAYDESGCLVSVRVSDNTNLSVSGGIGSASVSLDVSGLNAKSVKAYAWESVNSLKAVIEAKGMSIQ